MPDRDALGQFDAVPLTDAQRAYVAAFESHLRLRTPQSRQRVSWCRARMIREARHRPAPVPTGVL